MSGGGSKEQTVGYWYHPIIHMALHAGPVDALLEVRGGDVPAWRGQLEENGELSIDKAEMWGGESSEGGIVGQLSVRFGGAGQAADSWISSNLGADDSAHRGLVTAFWRGGRFGAMNPYPKALAFKTLRLVKGWPGDVPWYPEKVRIELEPETVILIGDVWQYRQLATHANPGHTNLVPPTSGFSTGPGPFGQGPAPGVPAAATAWAVGTVLWVQRSVTIERDRELVVNVRFENGCVVLFDGEVVEALNADNVDVSGSIQSGTVRIGPFGAKRTGLLQVKAFDEVPAANVTYLSVTSRSVPVLAMNPAHAIYYSLVAPSMQGEPVELVDDASFRAAADLFFAEGFGICDAWDPDQETVEAWRTRICSTIGANCTRSSTNGKWYLDVLRGAQDVGALPVLTDDDILDYEAEPSVMDDAVNQVAVRYFDPYTKQTRTTAPLQALGAIETSGVNPQTLEFLAVPVESLALRVAARELRARATPLWRHKLTTNRRPYAWRLGTYFRLQAPKRGIADMVCMVGEIARGELRSGAIQLTAVQDVYSLPATTYVDVQPPVESGPTDPVPASEQFAAEAPYAELVGRLTTPELDALGADAGFLLAFAARPASGLINFRLHTRPAAGEYAEAGTFDWCPAATILEASVTRQETAFTFAQASLVDRVIVGTAAEWGNEIVRVDAIDTDAATITLARGCLDTTPQAHAAGERLYFFERWSATDQTEYLAGEIAQAKVQPRSGTDALLLDDAPEMSVEFDSRAARPYPPGRLRLNGEAYINGSAIAPEVTWAHRHRVLQADQVVDTAPASIGPEEGTTYNAFARDDQTGELLDSESGIAGTSWTPNLSLASIRPAYQWSDDSATIVVRAGSSVISARLPQSPAGVYRLGLAFERTDFKALPTDDFQNEITGLVVLGGDVYYSWIDGSHASGIRRSAAGDLQTIVDEYLAALAADFTAGVVSDGTHLWAIGFYTGTLKKLDADLAEVDSFACPTGVRQIHYDAGGVWWPIAGGLRRFDVVAETTADKVLGVTPERFAVFGNVAFVLASGRVRVFDLTTSAELASHATDEIVGGAGSSAAPSFRLYDGSVATVGVRGAGGYVRLLDPLTGEEAGRITVPDLEFIAGADGASLWVSTRPGPGLLSTYAYEPLLLTEGPRRVRVEVESERGDLVSWQRNAQVFDYTVGGLLSEAGLLMVTEADEPLAESEAT